MPESKIGILSESSHDKICSQRVNIDQCNQLEDKIVFLKNLNFLAAIAVRIIEFEQSGLAREF